MNIKTTLFRFSTLTGLIETMVCSHSTLPVSTRISFVYSLLVGCLNSYNGLTGSELSTCVYKRNHLLVQCLWKKDEHWHVICWRLLCHARSLFSKLSFSFNFFRLGFFFFQGVWGTKDLAEGLFCCIRSVLMSYRMVREQHKEREGSNYFCSWWNSSSPKLFICNSGKNYIDIPDFFSIYI